MDRLCNIAQQKSHPLLISTTKTVYDATLPGSPLRRLVADSLAWDLQLSHPVQLIEAVPELLYDALAICKGRLERRDRSRAPYYEDVCRNYHVHREGNRCSFTAGQAESM